MKFTPLAIPDIILVEPNLHGDDRGYFVETFRQDLFNEAVGGMVNFVQDNESKSSKGVLRGLHYQVSPFSQSKLVKVIEGSVLDVALDIRRPLRTPFNDLDSLSCTKLTILPTASLNKSCLKVSTK